MVKFNNPHRILFVFILTLNCICVGAKLKFTSLRDSSGLWVEFFVEEFFNLESLPVAILNSKGISNLNSALPVVMSSMRNSIFIFDSISNLSETRASFLIIEESNFTNINQTFIELNNMFFDTWTRFLFWFFGSISEETENLIISQCYDHSISPIVIVSALENNAAFKLISTNNILNTERNLISLTLNQTNIKFVVREVIKNMERFAWDFEGAVLRVKAHPKYLMLQHRKTKGLSGVDASALRNMAKMLNFKVKLIMGIKNHFGNTFPNGSLVSSILDLKSHKVDLNINRHVVISHPEVTMLPALDTEDFCFILPYFRGYYEETSVIRLLSPETWALVLLSVVCSTLMWRMFNSVSRTDDYPSLSILQSFLTTKLFKTQRPFQMIFLLFWSGFVFVLLTVFRGMVLKSIIKPFWVDEITNMEELLRSNLKIKNRIGIFQVALPNSTLEKLLNRSVVSHLIETDFEFRTSAYFTSKYFRLFLDTVLGGKDHYYTIPECLSDCYVTYLVPSRSPYFKGLKRKVLHLQQYGFYIAWLQNFQVKSKLIEEGDDTFYFANSTRDVKTRPFTLQDLMFVFYIQTAGVLLSVVVFVIEVKLLNWHEGDNEIPFGI